MLQRFNITKQHKKTQHNVRKYKQYYNSTKQYNKIQNIVIRLKKPGYIITHRHNKT